MLWLILSVLCMFGWGLTDILYKKGSPREDTLSCYKFMVWLGIIMGTVAIVLFPMSESGTHLPARVCENIMYILVPLSYPIAVMVGLNGKRYLEISVASPLENIDGAIAPILMVAFFLITGTIDSIGDMASVLDILGIVLVLISVVLIGGIEQKLADTNNPILPDGKKKRIGAAALLFPFIYSFFDAICTSASGIVLYDEGTVAVGEIDFLVVESCAFVLIGLFSFFYLWYKQGKPYHPFRKEESLKFAGGMLELFGNVCYTYAVAINPVLVTPITSSYCIVTILGARILLKEKLQKRQYLCIAMLAAGILILAISEGRK